MPEENIPTNSQAVVSSTDIKPKENLSKRAFFKRKSTIIIIATFGAIFFIALFTFVFFKNQSESPGQKLTTKISTQSANIATPSAKEEAPSASTSNSQLKDSCKEVKTSTTEICTILNDLSKELSSAWPNEITIQDTNYKPIQVFDFNYRDIISGAGTSIWKLPNGEYVTIKGVNYSIVLKNKYFTYNSQINEEIIDNLKSAVENYFGKTDFARDTLNPVRILETEYKNSANPIPDAYSKNGVFCSVAVKEVTHPMDVYCGVKDLDMEKNKEEFKDAVKKAEGNIYFDVEKKMDDWAILNKAIEYPRQMVFHKENGQWVYIWTAGGMQPPGCSNLDIRKIPRKLFGACYEKDGSLYESN